MQDVQLDNTFNYNDGECVRLILTCWDYLYGQAYEDSTPAAICILADLKLALKVLQREDNDLFEPVFDHFVLGLSVEQLCSKYRCSRYKIYRTRTRACARLSEILKGDNQ